MNQYQTSAKSARLFNTSTLIASFSVIVEWYDFTLYLFLATLISKVFFGGGEHSLLLTLLGFALSYFLRPLGAMFFGHIGDRYGRKTSLISSMMIMIFAMLVTAMLPTYSQIGIASGVLMILLRFFMAFSIGGEYTSIITYLLENAPKNKRSFMASLAPGFSEIGALLAVFTSALTHLLDPEILFSWGWRIPFILGAILAVIVFLMRHKMDESIEFEEAKKTSQILKSPLLHALKHQKSAIIKAFSVSALGSITYYVGIAYIPTFLSNSYPSSISLWLSTIASTSVILVTPIFGLLADKYGRKRILICLAISCAIFPISLFYIMKMGLGLALLGAVILAILAAGVSSVAASTNPAQFHIRNRLSGLSLGGTTATAIFGGLTPLIAQFLIDKTGVLSTPGIMIAIISLAVIPVFFKLKESSD